MKGGRWIWFEYGSHGGFEGGEEDDDGRGFDGFEGDDELAVWLFRWLFDGGSGDGVW